MTDDSVCIEIPATADHVSLLRALVGIYAARQDFTLDEVDDLRMAVEEAAIQLLRRLTGDRLELTVSTVAGGVVAALSGAVAPDEPVVDRSSFSWTILNALADDVAVDTRDRTAVVSLSKLRSVAGGLV